MAQSFDNPAVMDEEMDTENPLLMEENEDALHTDTDKTSSGWKNMFTRKKKKNDNKTTSAIKTEETPLGGAGTKKKKKRPTKKNSGGLQHYGVVPNADISKFISFYEMVENYKKEKPEWSAELSKKSFKKCFVAAFVNIKSRSSR